MSGEAVTVTQAEELVRRIEEAGRGYSIRLTRLVDDEAEYTMVYRGETTIHASNEDAHELRQRLAEQERVEAALDFLVATRIQSDAATIAGLRASLQATAEAAATHLNAKIAADATIADLTARLAEAEAKLRAPKVEFYQQDWMPGFAAFLPDSTTPSPDAKAFCVLNVGALTACVATGDIGRADLPYIIADSIVHELVHVLEQWAGVEFDEDRTEAVVERYRAAALKEASDAAE